MTGWGRFAETGARAGARGRACRPKSCVTCAECPALSARYDPAAQDEAAAPGFGPCGTASCLSAQRWRVGEPYLWLHPRQRALLAPRPQRQVARVHKRRHELQESSTDAQRRHASGRQGSPRSRRSQLLLLLPGMVLPIWQHGHPVVHADRCQSLHKGTGAGIGLRRRGRRVPSQTPLSRFPLSDAIQAAYDLD